MVIIAFDVNETLLSLEPIGALLRELFGEPAPTGEWFARLLHGSLVLDHLDQHEPFATVAGQELQRIAARRDRTITDDDVRQVGATMQRLPAHPDVAPGLARLADDGHRLVAFSNGAPTALAAQLAHAGLTGAFADVVSVDDPGGGVFKPDRAAYEHLCRRLDAFAEEVTMVASHDWDVAGARAAGLSGIFLERQGGWHLPLPAGTTVTTVGEVGHVVVGKPA